MHNQLSIQPQARATTNCRARGLCMARRRPFAPLVAGMHLYDTYGRRRNPGPTLKHSVIECEHAGTYKSQSAIRGSTRSCHRILSFSALCLQLCSIQNESHSRVAVQNDFRNMMSGTYILTKINREVGHHDAPYGTIRLLWIC